MSLEKEGSPWQRLMFFYEGLKEVGGDESKIHVVYGKIPISFFVGGAMAAKYSPGRRWSCRRRLEYLT